MADGKIDYTALEEALGKDLYKAIEQALTATASNGIAMMRMRIEKGVGSSGESMPAYTPRYRKRRKDIGRPPDKRDLFVSGQLLGGIHLESVETKGADIVATLGIAGARNRVLAVRHEQTAPWFDFTPTEKATLTNMLRDQLDKAIEADHG